MPAKEGMGAHIDVSLGGAYVYCSGESCSGGNCTSKQGAADGE